MAVASSSVYDKGSPLGPDKDWYHGQLTRVEAEQALTASGCDCFLIREDGRALVLSLTHHRQVHHVNIKYGPGSYELEGYPVEYSFTGLSELVSHYSRECIGPELRITLRVPCKKSSGTGPHEASAHHYETIKDRDIIYSHGNPSELTSFNWYHGTITREQADAALSMGRDNEFLIWQSTNNLVLSMRINGWASHNMIQRSSSGYCLNRKSRGFRSVPEMVAHYQQFPICESTQQVLATACRKLLPTGSRRKRNATSFRKKEEVIRISWRPCADLPIVISAPQMLKIGDHVYMGGGYRKTDSSTIYSYNIRRDTWTQLTFCPTYQHSLATLDGKLIILGGELQNGATNMVFTLQGDVWKKSLPPMPTPRYSVAALSHENRLIVAAGGKTSTTVTGEVLLTDIVEVYIKGKQWYATKRLPFPTSTFSITTVGDKCYMLGGTGNAREVCTVLYTSLSSLVEIATKRVRHRSAPQALVTWKTLNAKHPLIYSPMVEIDGRITAISGSSEHVLRCGTKFICVYNFEMETWVECKGAELPLALYRVGVVKLSKDKVMVVGGQPKMQEFSSKVFIGTFQS